MIDWVHCKLPFEWDQPICGGKILKVDQDGVQEYETLVGLNVAGSYDSNIRLVTRERGYLELSGNPAKWLQGHNLVGSRDLIGLVVACVTRVLSLIGHAPTPDELTRWTRGDFRLSRVHVNQMFELNTIGDVRAWIRAASDQASIKYKRSQSFREGTLYIGKNKPGARRTNWFFKIYCKHDEICKHELHSELPMRDQLYEWSKTMLRVELEINTEELKRSSPISCDTDYHDEYTEFGYDLYPGNAPWKDTYLYGTAWRYERHVGLLFDKYFSRLNLGDNVMIPENDLSKLKPHLRDAYDLWDAGHDLRERYSKAKYFRIKKDLLSYGVDISAKRAKSNVIQLSRVLTYKPVETPSWIRNNAILFFDPRRAA